MKRTWIAVIAVALLTLTSAAFIKEQLRSESAMGEEIGHPLAKFKEMLSNIHGLSSDTEEAESSTPFSAVSEQEEHSAELFSTQATQWTKAQLYGRNPQEFSQPQKQYLIL